MADDFFADLPPLAQKPSVPAPVEQDFFDQLPPLSNGAALEKITPQRSIQQEQQDLARGFLRGAEDVPEGAGQLIAHVGAGLLPESSGFPSAAASIDKFIADREAAYNKKYASGHAPAVDLGRIGGQAAAVIPLAMAVPGAAADSAVARFLSGVGSGAISSTFQPAQPGPNFATQKLEQAGAGALGGAGGALTMSSLARGIAGSENPFVQRLMQSGIRPTPGQIAGGLANNVEQKLTSVPVLGDVIQNARRGAVEDLNRAASNDALAHIGEAINKDTPAGRAMVQELHDKVSGAYDRLLPKLTWQGDKQFADNVNSAIQNANLLPDRKQQLVDILQNQFSKISNAQMSGKTFKEVDSELGREAAEYLKDPSIDARKVGYALRDVQTQLRGALTRSNPQYAPDLKAIDAAYADKLRVEAAASRPGEEPGVFSPPQLSAAVRQLDKSLGHGAFSRGTARMQDLSDAGRAVLGSTVPDSGTAGRGMLAGLAAMALAGGEGHYLPIVGPYMLPAAAAIAGGAGLYSTPGRAVLAHMLASRPAVAAPIASVVRRATPAVTGLGGILAGQYAP